MSVCLHAKPLGKNGWKNGDGKPTSVEHLTVTCECGWHGDVTELLGCDEGECGDTLWCPKCHTAAWSYD